jgi:hypothetical protein
MINTQAASPAEPIKTLDDLIADKLAAADAGTRAALLRIPLDNIDRWLANGYSAPHRLEQWRQIVLQALASAEGFEDLLARLRDPSETAQRLREFGPFAGVLTAAERLPFIRQCVYSH